MIDIDPDEVLLSFMSPAQSFTFHGRPNDAGYLAKLISDPFDAVSRSAAEKVASTSMRSLLSNLSVCRRITRRPIPAIPNRGIKRC
jgi:hypothetical protein